MATTAVPGEAYLRLERVGDVYTGSVSIDGSNWTPVGAQPVVGDFRPVGVGLGAETGYQEVTEIAADFDYFQVEDDSLRVFLPAIKKE